MRGRKPDPSELKKLKGQWRARDKKARENEAVAQGDLSEPPEHYDDERIALWRYAIEHAPKGVLKQIDQATLEAWVDSLAIYRQANAALKKDGLVTITKDGNVIQNPYLAIANKQKLIMAKLASELGFTPASRSRVKVIPNEEKKQDNAFSQFQSLAVIRGGKS